MQICDMRNFKGKGGWGWQEYEAVCGCVVRVLCEAGTCILNWLWFCASLTPSIISSVGDAVLSRHHGGAVWPVRITGVPFTLLNH